MVARPPSSSTRSPTDNPFAIVTGSGWSALVALWLAMALLVVILPTTVAAAPDPGCDDAVAEAAIRTRSAQYDEAERLYQDAMGVSPWCRARALAGMASVWNSRGDGKKAVKLAEQAIDASDDAEVQSIAYHQIGRALFRKGQRAGKKTARAEDALRRAVALSEGRDETIVHALARLYRETKQNDQLVALAEAHPDIKLWTREDQAALFRRTTSSCTKGSAASFWTRPLPRFAVRTALGASALEDIEVGIFAVEDEDASSETEDADLDEGEAEAADVGGGANDDLLGAAAHDVEAGTDEDEAPLIPEAFRDLDRPVWQDGEAPRYTDLARRTRARGVARLEAFVGKDGEVERVRVRKGFNPALDRSAQEAICHWLFASLEVEGKAHPFYLEVEADFRKQQAAKP